MCESTRSIDGLPMGRMCIVVSFFHHALWRQRLPHYTRSLGHSLIQRTSQREAIFLCLRRVCTFQGTCLLSAAKCMADRRPLWGSRWEESSCLLLYGCCTNHLSALD